MEDQNCSYGLPVLYSFSGLSTTPTANLMGVILQQENYVSQGLIFWGYFGRPLEPSGKEFFLRWVLLHFCDVVAG